MQEILARCLLFKGYDQEKIDTIFSRYPYQVKTYAKDQTVVLRNEKCESLMIIIEGQVRGEMLDFSGKIVKIEDISAPNMIASAFLFGDTQKFPVDVLANEQTRILSIQKPYLLKIFQQERTILENYLNAISNRAQFLSKKIWFMSFKTLKEKIAHYLLQLAPGEQNTIQLNQSQEELAKYFGVARPSFSRSLGELEKEGFIEIRRREIFISDKRRLADIIKN